MTVPVLGHLESLPVALPELALTGLAALVLLADLAPRWRGRGVASSLAIVGMAVVLPLVVVAHARATGTAGYADAGEIRLFRGAVAYDGAAALMKALLAVVGLLGLLFSRPSLRRRELGEGELAGLLVTAVLGMCLLASASSLLMLAVALELTSLPAYAMTGLLRRNRRSSEAALKYAIFGAVATGTMIYGISLLLGIAGTAALDAIGPALEARRSSGAPCDPSLAVAFLLILVGLGYKVAAVPFHFWCPDAYEGAPTAVTAFLSVGPKAAGFAALLRLTDGCFGGPLAHGDFPWQAILAVLGVATMTIGNLAALPQRNLKRLFAYSSIAHAGYLLAGAALAGPSGAQAVLFYLVVYAFMNLGAFACVLALEDHLCIIDVEGCRGVGWKHPGLAAAFTVFLLSLTGIPPVAGFAAKLVLFGALVQTGAWPWLALAVAGVLNSVLSLFYYARIIRSMYLEHPPATEAGAVREPLTGFYNALLWICLVPTVALGVAFGPLVEWTRRAAEAFRN